MLEFRAVTPELAPHLLLFFKALIANGDDRHFRPHALDAEGAGEVANHHGRDLYYVAVDSDAVIAYGLLRGWDAGFAIPSLGIAVHPQHRGTHVARAMMDFLHAAAQARGAPRVRLRVHNGNQPAVSLYRNTGYVFDDRVDGTLLTGYYPLRTGRHIPWARPILFGDEKRHVAAAIDSTAISGGPYVDSFERAFAEIHGVKPTQVLAVANGTCALQLALQMVPNFQRGDEVIVPGFGFMAAANMVLAAGAQPVFADVLSDTWLIDPADVQRKLTERTRAIVAVHTYGNICDMGWLNALGVPVIEDCAESAFSRYHFKPCGSLGAMATFSFQATKTITCGEGGAVILRDADTRQARLVRSHGMPSEPSARKYHHTVAGFNFRLTNIQAAMVYAQLTHRDEICQLRRDTYTRYCARLNAFTLQVIRPAVEPVMWGMGVRVAPGQRDRIAAALLVDGIETRPGFHAASMQPLYRDTGTLPVSEALSEEIILLPMPTDLDEADLNYVCDRFVAACETA